MGSRIDSHGGPHASRTHWLWLSRGPQTNDRENSICGQRARRLLDGTGKDGNEMGLVVELLFTAFL